MATTKAPRMQRRVAVPALMLASIAAGCDRSAEQTRTHEAAVAKSADLHDDRLAGPPSNPAFVRSIAEGNRAFGLSLYQQLAAQPGNVFISPISIAGAFGPVVAGAEGETRAVIARALRFPADGGPALHPGLGRLMRGLERDQNGTTLSIANALWVQQGFTMKPAFVGTARENYGATSENLDFIRAPAAAAARINAWVNGKTRGRIPTLFSPDAFTVRTRLVVTNAVYFLGDWAEPFRPSATQQQLFYLLGGGARRVPLMSREGQYRTFGTKTFTAIDLPYRDERLSMTVFLPHARAGLPAFEAGLNPERLAEWLGKLDRAQPGKTQLYLPRLQITRSYDLEKPLSALGMGLVFTPRANFRGIANADLYVDRVAHKTFVRMDEKGTEAAAATGVVVATVSAPLPFRADHPFFFLLRDKKSGAILFMGRIAELGTGPTIDVVPEANPGNGRQPAPPAPPAPPPSPPRPTPR